jgi:hypothetical protein
MDDSNQFSFYFAHEPNFDVPVGSPTPRWHPIASAQDAVQAPEWACLIYMQALAKPASGHSGILRISHDQLCAGLALCKSGVQRTLRRLLALQFIVVIETGRARGSETTYLVYHQNTVEEIVRRSGCTHYCMQGEKRRLFRAIP